MRLRGCGAEKGSEVRFYCLHEELPCWWPLCLCQITAKSITWYPFNTINYFGVLPACRSLCVGKNEFLENASFLGNASSVLCWFSGLYCVYEISAVCHWQNPKSTSNVSLGHGDYLLQREAKCFETGPLGQTAHTRWQSLISHISLSLSIARNPRNRTEGKLTLSIYEPQECSRIFWHHSVILSPFVF